MPSPFFSMTPGSLCALVSIVGTTDVVSWAQSVASVAVTTTKRKYRVTLLSQAGGTVDNLFPTGWTQATAAAGRMLRISYVSDGVYDVEVVDSTGAAADATGQIIVGFYRGGRVS